MIKLRENIYYVGANDWNIREFHGYSTKRGTSYNAYLIIDEKIALIDTVKKEFSEELLQNISQIIDPSKIDYIISNHVEMDHSGALPSVMDIAKNATIITSDPNGMKGLISHFGKDYPYQVVKSGDEISLGKNTLTFVATPMVHWPDNMVTYCKQEKILFSNDAFGEHYASNCKFDDEEDLRCIMEEAKKYYANIVMPYGMQTRKAIDVVTSLDINMIAPSHGVIWRKYVSEIIEKYRYFSNDIPEEKALIIYDSMWKSTQKIAYAILNAFSRRKIATRIYDLKVNDMSDIMAEVLKAKYIIVGSPTLNNNMLPSVAGFLTYMRGLAPKNKKALAFGSYGWGGQSIGQVEEELKKCKFEIITDAIKVQYIPTREQLGEIEEKIENILEAQK